MLRFLKSSSSLADARARGRARVLTGCRALVCSSLCALGPAQAGSGDAALLTPGARAPAPAASEGVTARELLEKWVEARRTISSEKRELAEAMGTLRDRIAVLQAELQAMKTRVREAEQNLTESDKKRAELVAENERLQQATARLTQELPAIEAKTRELVRRLPDPVRDGVKVFSQRIPEQPEQTKASLGERFQNVVAVLNEVNKANRDVRLASEVRTLPDGTKVEVTAVYFGLGQAYYVGSDKKIAGVGEPSADGWTWRPANESAEAIAKVVAILKKDGQAAFVSLPVRVQ